MIVQDFLANDLLVIAHIDVAAVPGPVIVMVNQLHPAVARLQRTRVNDALSVGVTLIIGIIDRGRSRLT